MILAPTFIKVTWDAGDTGQDSIDATCQMKSELGCVDELKTCHQLLQCRQAFVRTAMYVCSDLSV